MQDERIYYKLCQPDNCASFASSSQQNCSELLCKSSDGFGPPVVVLKDRLWFHTTTLTPFVPKKPSMAVWIHHCFYSVDIPCHLHMSLDCTYVKTHLTKCPCSNFSKDELNVYRSLAFKVTRQTGSILNIDQGTRTRFRFRARMAPKRWDGMPWRTRQELHSMYKLSQ